jgi:hypothetical protein
LGWIQGDSREWEPTTNTREPDLPRNIVASIPLTIANQEVFSIPPSVFTIIFQIFSLILGADLRTLTMDVGEDDTLKPWINVNVEPRDQCRHESKK